MTDAVRAKAEELKYAILNSEEYKNFDGYRRKLKSNQFLNVYIKPTIHSRFYFSEKIPYIKKM